MKCFVVMRDNAPKGEPTGIIVEGVVFQSGAVFTCDLNTYVTAQYDNEQAVENTVSEIPGARLVWLDDDFQVLHRDAGTGRFVTEEFAEANPEKTVTENG